MFEFAQIPPVCLFFEFCLSELEIQRARTWASSNMKVTVRGEKTKTVDLVGYFPLQQAQPPAPQGKNSVHKSHDMLDWIPLGS